MSGSRWQTAALLGALAAFSISSGGGSVRLDEVTAGLLDSRFDAVHLYGGVYELRGERQSHSPR